MTNEECFRLKLIESLRRELIGPECSSQQPENVQGELFKDILQESPVQRYSAGVLFPSSQPIIEIEDFDVSDEEEEKQTTLEENISDIHVKDPMPEPDQADRSGDVISDAYDETVRMANEFLPSAIGLTFIADVSEGGITIAPHAAIYKSKKPNDPDLKLREWHRTELDIKPVILQIEEKAKGIRTFQISRSLNLRAIYHQRKDGAYLITVTMYNTRSAVPGKYPSGSDCFFQTGLIIKGTDNSYIFKEYRIIDRKLKDPEEAALELLYRSRKAFAVGHGCAVDWGDEFDDKTNRLATSTIPSFKVVPVLPRTKGGDELSMYILAGAEGCIEKKSIPNILGKVAQDYEKWINDQYNQIETLPQRFREAAGANLDSCEICLARIRSGIELLGQNEMILTAFMLANQAILMQQYHTRREKRSVEGEWQELPTSYKPADEITGRWRTFQLVFILMNLTSIVPLSADADHSDRNLVDIIWFPTGGGKTEAYLGLAACDIFFRRLMNPSNAGCTVIMRYTLRLLTAQQFQRASALICACESIRRRDAQLLGDEPISIGLWVGESLTPIRRQEAIRVANALANKQKSSKNPFQLLKCPWCGTELDNKDHLGYVPHHKPKTVIFICPETRCPFSLPRKNRIPVMVIDEDIYATPPTLIIGTVDKFAMLAWRKMSGKIFGIKTDYDPPDLIIQDELHLISGPLGSVVGLYENVIDLLCSWRGRSPKLVASTATIRCAPQQCLSLYDRQTFQFPPQGLDISDSFFAAENRHFPGRIYVGVFASAAPSFVTAMVRTLSALFQYCKSLPLPQDASESIRDPYWTVVQYFNSLRELGHAATLVEADIPEYTWAIASREHIPKELCRRYLYSAELTSRRTADEIPRILERLEVSYPKESGKKQYPLDTLLATNMISVGVDVSRLGLMVVAGQPKTTSEYIQATSRVGRSDKAPGLVVAMYNPGKPRDRSHYEHFRSFHSAFYKYVEPTSVTPFSIPVLERALHAVLVIIARHLGDVDKPDEINPVSTSIEKAIDSIRERCCRIDSEHADVLKNKLQNLLFQWNEFKPGLWGQFGKPPENQPLMYPAGTEPRIEWDMSWPTPSSMRNVDIECQTRIVSTYPNPNDNG